LLRFASVRHHSPPLLSIITARQTSLVWASCRTHHAPVAGKGKTPGGKEGCRLHGQSLHLASAVSRPRTQIAAYCAATPFSRLASSCRSRSAQPSARVKRVSPLSQRPRMIGPCTCSSRDL
jgi:hypothetical protein